jgi:acetyl-CoA carboxylase biotin carboxyl carrier protein
MTVQKSFTQDDVEQILRVVDGLSDVEVRLEVGDLKLHVRKFSGGSDVQGARLADVPAAAPRPAATPDARPAVPAASPAPARATAEGAAPADAVPSRAPMLGAFYRAPSPAEPAFVQEGSRVRAGDPVCIIEVMKLFNTVNAEVDGTIVSIVAENGQMVEQDDILFYVKVEG